MQLLFTILLVIHIAGGFTGLISGTLAASVKKGSRLHNFAGKWFFVGMLTASLAALVLSNLPGHHNMFLFSVGGFTLYMICSGYRFIFLNRQLKHKPVSFSFPDYSIFLFGLCFSLFLIGIGISSLFQKDSFGIVPGVFGMICIRFVYLDYVMLFRNTEMKKIWLPNHITRMMGALIASYTAFLVVNIHFQPTWVIWLLPTVAGTVFIYYFRKKYCKS